MQYVDPQDIKKIAKEFDFRTHITNTDESRPATIGDVQKVRRSMITALKSLADLFEET